MCYLSITRFDHEGLMVMIQTGQGVDPLKRPGVLGWRDPRKPLSVEHYCPVSNGLTTPLPPRLRTCVYTMVVLTSLWPSRSWIVRIS